MLDDPFGDDLAGFTPVPVLTWTDGTPVEPPKDERPLRPSEALARAESRRRLHRTEAALAGSSQAEREAICNWLGSMLHQPPLDRPSAAYAPMRAFVDALWWDVADRTPDPLEPLALSPLILDSHPWGPGPDA